MKKYIIFIGFLSLCQIVIGQGVAPFCAHEEFHRNLLNTNPDYKNAFLEMERDIYEYTLQL